MLSELVSRVLAELGPWLWMLAGFILMAVEVFSGRGAALSLALGAMIAGTIAVFGASGVLATTSMAIQAMIFIVASFAIFVGLKGRSKTS